MVKIIQIGRTVQVLSFFLLLCAGCSSDPLDKILSEAGPVVREVVKRPDLYEVQILYVQIDRDEGNQPRFTEYSFNVNVKDYFYPASTVKFPLAILALDKLTEANIPGLDRNARVRIDSVRPPQTALLLDTTAEMRTPSIGHFIHRVFVTSDNEASNRLYEFLGPDEIHRRLDRHGFDLTRIVHRLGAPQFSTEDNRYTNPVTFFHSDTLVLEQPEVYANTQMHPRKLRRTKKGEAYINHTGDLVSKPFDFSEKNFFPLTEQVRLIKTVMFPAAFPDSMHLCLRPDDYPFLYRAMSMLPRESRFPAYDTVEYPDGYVKFFMFGDTRAPIPDHIRIFNKVGWAYGTMTDCAYIVDFRENVEFILAATVLVNEDGIFNDDAYDYETVGLPFMGQLGRAVHAYEVRRPRERDPDLSSLEAMLTEPDLVQ